MTGNFVTRDLSLIILPNYIISLRHKDNLYIYANLRRQQLTSFPWGRGTNSSGLRNRFVIFAQPLYLSIALYLKAIGEINVFKIECYVRFHDACINRQILRAEICKKIPGFSGDHSSVLKRDSLSISPHTSHTWSMMAIAADRCSRLFHAQIERGTLFRLKDNALFPVLRGEQCTHENRITRIKRADKRCVGWKKSAAQAAFIFHDCHLRNIFHFTLFSPF